MEDDDVAARARQRELVRRGYDAIARLTGQELVTAPPGLARVNGPGPDDHGGVQLGGTGDPRDQPAAGDDPGGVRRLALARLGQQVPARGQPCRRRGGHAPQLDERVILLCDEGFQSSLAAATLQQLGFAHATDVEGGFQAWRAAALPVEQPQTPV